MTERSSPLNFDDLSDLDVFGLWVDVMRDLRRRGLSWSGRSPLSDYAEFLVARFYGVEPLRGTTAGHDLVTPEGRKIQVKARRYGAGSKPSHFGEFSELERQGFDEFVGVLFEDDFTVRSAHVAPYEFVVEQARPVLGKHRLYISSLVNSPDPRVSLIELDQT